jgi:hypothetical protein
MNINKIYNTFLYISIVIIWLLMIIAKYTEYDINFGYAIYAFLLSNIVTLILLFLLIIKKSLLKQNIISTILFLFIASPLSIFIFVELYHKFIGQYFNL